MLVDALLTVLDWDYLVGKLRDKCVASSWTAANRLRDKVLEQNESYQELLQLFDRLEDVKAGFEAWVQEEVEAVAEPHVADWRDEEDDPATTDFQEHMTKAKNWSGPWRPFDEELRTSNLVELLRDDAADGMLAAFAEFELDWSS